MGIAIFFAAPIGAAFFLSHSHEKWPVQHGFAWELPVFQPRQLARGFFCTRR